MSSVTHEFVCYDPDFNGEFGDFTNDNVFTPEKRREYLSAYNKFLKNCYNIGDEPEYAVPLSEVREKLVEFGTKEGIFSKVKAYRREKRSLFKNWQLFTEKAKVHDGKLVLSSAELPPNPSAEYYLDNDSRLLELCLNFKMGSQYAAENHGIVRDTTTVRTIELRCGTEEIVKICFYHNGECYVRRLDDDPYHLKFIKIGEFNFDEVNNLKIKLCENSYSVELNNSNVDDLPFILNTLPDTVFFGSGMFHFGDWEIELLSLKYEDVTITDFFVEENKKICEEEFIGEVTLPYAIGCMENRNKQLILEKEFTLPDTSKVELYFDSLDPGGEIYIDGEQVYSTDKFHHFTLDISHLERRKNHELKVIVHPRAPEVLFCWHRQKDPLNGWFCGEISLKGYNEFRFSDLKAVTNNIDGNKISATFFGAINSDCTVAIYIEKVFGGTSPIKKIAEFKAKGEFAKNAVFEADAWDIGTPNLYNVFFRVVRENDIFAEKIIETGFRKIEQKNGEIHLNNRRIDLKGALLMQFLPPYNKTSETHICPSDEQILWQEMMLKAMGGNTLRLHILGYGSNDARYAHFADRLGILLIWTTRYIDSIESVQWQGKWRAKEAYVEQIKNRINHPSIIMWEGSNELRPNNQQINDAFSEFVPAVKAADQSRLICPVSHLYYAADLYPTRGCEYLSEDGLHDHNGNLTDVSEYWDDELVVRSAHTYSLLCGYGTGWDKMRLQSWGEQEKLINSDKHAYTVSEYAVIGRQNPNTKEANLDYFNSFSYEFSDEKPLGIDFSQNDWEISQAYQALCAYHCTKKLRLMNVDGFLWCCLMGGANDGGYLKPLIDNYGYKKSGFHTIKSAFQEVCAFVDKADMKFGGKFSLKPVLFGKIGKKYDVVLSCTDRFGNLLKEHVYSNITVANRITYLPEYDFGLTDFGYYGIKLEVYELTDF